MALANSRPYQIPTTNSENEILLNTTSPTFQASALNYTPDSTAVASPIDSKIKRENSGFRRETGTPDISKMVPVTGERPMPIDRAPPLDDDVLYAVFVILWEKDADQQGMTVKQLCDHLLTKHPEMSNLSTKLSNLISAKLNAYVKKIEKGEKTMIYSLSREWSDSSPRRMLYVYRGVLSPDYKQHAQAASLKLKQQQEQVQQQQNTPASTSRSTPSITTIGVDESVPFSKNLNNGLSFQMAPDFNVPYASSPVSLNLTPRSSSQTPVPTTDQTNFSHISSSQSSTALMNKKRGGFEDATSSSKKLKSKSKSHSDLSNSSTDSSSTYITAAAAAPRLSKHSSKDSLKSNNTNTASVIAAIHKLISTQTPIESASNNDINANHYINQQSSVVKHWVKTVREGFLIQDIESPEDLTLEDLDNMFK